MKRALYVTFALLLLSGSIHAQWPQQIYGSSTAPINEELTDGRITNLQNKPGYMLAGVNRSGANLNLFSLTRTNPSGIVAAGSPYFKNNYQLGDALSWPTSLRVGEFVVEENGDHFVTAGSFSRGAIYNYGVFFQQINFDGTLIPLTMPNVNIGYRPLEPNLFQAASVKKIIRSQRYPGNFYILGSLTYANSTRQIAFVLRVTATGSLVWSSSYSVNITSTASTVPFDLVESVKSNAGIYELLIVGEYYPQTTGNADAFVMRINALNGVINNPNVQLYGTAASHDGFTCIKTSQNPYFDASLGGYIIGGHSNSNINTGKDFWFVGIKQGGNIVTNSLFNYTVLNSDHCSDIIEHNSGGWQYYLAGYTNNGLFNNEDMFVVGTDQTGTPFAPGQYTFGSGNNQRCVRMHKDNGLALFGSSTGNLLHPTASQDMYLVRSSFAGFSDCNSFRQFLPRVAGPQAMPVVPCTGGLRFSTIPTYTRPVSTLDQKIVCCTAKPKALMHWNFDNGSLVDDVSGFTANAFGGVTPTLGLLSTPSAMDFDGFSGYLRVPFNPIMELKSWTIAALVRPDGFYNGLCQANSIVWRGNDQGPNCYGLWYLDNNFDNDCNVSTPSHIFQGYPAGPYPGAFSDPVGPNPCISNPCVNLGQWYCVWGSYDATTGKMDTYVDGVLVSSLNWPDMYSVPSTEDLFIGASSYASWGGPFPYYLKGAIDDIAIYDGPLTCPLDCNKAANGQHKPTSVQPLQSVPGKDVTLSPNPATAYTELSTGANWSGATIQVLNATAQVEMEIAVDASGKTSLDIAELPAGLYLIRIQNNKQYTVLKLIKR